VIIGKPAMHSGGHPDEEGRGASDAQTMTARATAASSTEPIRVLLAISHGRTRTALRSALESTGRVVVVAEVASPLHLATTAVTERAEVVMFDVRLAPPGVSPSLADVVASLGGVPLVAVDLEGDPAFARAALQSGASAHVLTDTDPENYLHVVDAVLAG
jgi:two-component system response regulator NreC